MNPPESPLSADNALELFEALERMCSSRRCAHIDNLVVAAGSEVHTRSWNEHDTERPVDTYSLTKPIVTGLVGCALQDGHLESIDVHVADFLPSARAHHSGVTVRHLLTMTMSIAGDGFLDIDRIMGLESSWVDAILSLGGERPPGAAFSYDNRTAHLTAALLETVLPEGLLPYADQRLLGPLGCSGWTWPVDTEDIPYGFGHLRVSALDLARFGRLWLNGGRHAGSRLIDEGFVMAAWRPASDGGPPEHRPYGQTWWCDADASPPVWFAAGYAGQLLAVVPSSGMVVVITGSEARLTDAAPPSYELLRKALADRAG